MLKNMNEEKLETKEQKDEFIMDGKVENSYFKYSFYA